MENQDHPAALQCSLVPRWERIVERERDCLRFQFLFQSDEREPKGRVYTMGDEVPIVAYTGLFDWRSPWHRTRRIEREKKTAISLKGN